VSNPEATPAAVAAHAPHELPEGRRGALGRLRDQPLAYRLGSLVVVLAVWEALGPYIDPIFFSYPSAIANAFHELTVSGELQKYFLQSIQILLYGMLFAIIGGIALGVVMARFTRLEWTLDVYVNALYATPMVALVPLLVLWLGIHVQAKVVIVLLFAIFPILINTYQGVKNVDPGLLEVAKSFNTTERRMWFDVLFPSAIPYIAAGIRLAIGRALVGMVIAEFYTAISGLGYMVTRYAHIFQMDKTLVPVILLMVMGVTFSAVLKYVEARIAPWNQAHKR
jgi:NitT/TauT family transport system permease protein